MDNELRGSAMPALSDSELLARYATTKDESAFAELVSRHAPMVWRTCLRMLGDAHEAEDASQAAFLILARKAGAFRSGKDADVAGWLYGIAQKTAQKALYARTCRSRRLSEVTMRKTAEIAGCSSSDSGGLTPEQQTDWEAIDRELAALSAVQRQAVVLRYLEGRSVEEAAQIAGCPTSTLGLRATTGLERLRSRLTRHDVRLGATVLLLGLFEAEAQAAMPATLLPSILAVPKLTAASVTAGTATNAVVWADGVQKAMFYAKLKVAALVAVCVTTISGFAGWEVYSLHAEEAVAQVKNPPVVVAVNDEKAVATSKSVEKQQPKADQPAPVEAKPTLTEAQLTECVALLESQDKTVRKKAMKSLFDAGESARAALEKGAQSNLAEVKSRCSTLLGVLKTAPLVEKMIVANKTQNFEADILMEAVLMYKFNGHVKYRREKGLLCSIEDYVMDKIPLHIVSDGTILWTEQTVPVAGKDEIKKLVSKESVNTPLMKKTNNGDLVYKFSNVDYMDWVDVQESTYEGTPVYILSGKKREGVLTDEKVAEIRVLGGDGMLEVYERMQGQRITMGKEDLLVRKTEALNAEGEVMVLLQFSNFKAGITFEDSVFSYCPPVGVKIRDFDAEDDQMKKASKTAPTPAPAANGPHAKDDF